MQLDELIQKLRSSAVFEAKKDIAAAAKAFGSPKAVGIMNGDDAAAIPDGHGQWLLLAAEGVLPELCAANPELAGRSAVLANVNDIYAMGGRPLAMVDVTGAPDDKTLADLFRGMRDNARRFAVPIVGGHLMTGVAQPLAGMAILGRAEALITSFDAKAGDCLVLVTNMDGIWLRAPNYYNCTLAKHDAMLVENLELLPKAAEAGLTCAGKDVSNAGIAGTLIMLCESSRVGAFLDIDSIPLPKGGSPEDIEPWLRAFMSYGFLLTVQENNLNELLALFKIRNLFAAKIGDIVSGSKIFLKDHTQEAVLWDWAAEPFTGFAGRN